MKKPAGVKRFEKLLRRIRRKQRKKFRSPTHNFGFHPDLLRDLWRGVVRVAERLEQAIINTVTKHALGSGSKTQAQKELRGVINRGIGEIKQAANTALIDAEAIGRASAWKEIQQLQKAAPKPPINPQTGTTLRIPKELQKQFENMAPRLYGTGSKLFDEIVAEIKQNPPAGETTRRQTAQKILDKWAKRGIDAFEDKAGKKWNIVSYAEMATRTAANNLAHEAHLTECVKAGFDVVRVNTMPNCSPMCKPFQGRLLSITGKTAGEYGGEKIVATMAEAIAHGYRHPNCRHSATLWVPGNPKPSPEQLNEGDYWASQELRRLERGVRQWKRVQETALTPERKQQASRKVREWQQKIRDHVKETGIQRNRIREQINVAL